jgi:LuxR family transcriptional regulator, maltose regulon positive regulatory protein
VLIATKFHRPLTAGRLTLRPRLDSCLEDGLRSQIPLVLVTAPAGFGKSTLVSAWLRRQNISSSWLSLDSSDNDPGQFLSYFVGALQRYDPALGQSQINRIQTAGVADSEAVYSDVIKCLINEIAASPAPFLLVIDDCHLLKNQTVLQLLNFLVEYQPEQLRLILLSREDLPLPLSRLRVRKKIVEIRQTDLQFSPDEAEDFLREGMGISQLTPEEILILDRRTEGWIAGLQLAGLSIKSDPDPSHFIQSFTGSDRYILDYFMEEVFTRQPEDVQKFLLATSILERFSAPLCDIVLAEMYEKQEQPAPDSQAMLERMEHSNLFLIPLDNQRRWYRYHHLFADLLRHALAKVSPGQIPTLHLRASRWLEANGYIQEAVKHAFQAQDWTHAAGMVERHAWNMILHSQVGIVSDWCQTFPEAVISNRPALCIFHGWALIIAFKKDNFPAAHVRLLQAEAALPSIDAEVQASLVVGAQPVNMLAWVTGQLTLLHSFILMTEPRKLANPQALADLGLLSYDQLPPEDITGRSVGLLDMSYASQARSNAVDADQKFEHALRVALSGGNYFGAVVAEYHRAHGLFVQGRLREVISFCEQKKKTYGSYFVHPLQDLPAIALLDQAMGCAYLELNELGQAEQLLRSGLEVGQWMPREELPGYLALARLCEIKGDLDGMMESWRRLDMRWPDIKYCTHAMRIHFELKTNPQDPSIRQKALTWAETNVPEIGPDIVIPGIGPAWNDEADHAVYVAWARVQLLLGQPFMTLEVVRPMLEVAEQRGLIHRIIELSLIQAQALFLAGQQDRLLQPLRKAMMYAESQGYLRIVDQNPVLVRVLSEGKYQEISPIYVRRVLEMSGAVAPSSVIRPHEDSQSQENELIEPLSSRERDVLILLADGLSNPEIAARLYLSPNTLKAHTQHIFGKLGVHNRVQAVNKARELKIV